MARITYQQIREKMGSEHYPMTLVDRDAEVVVKVVNIGIDSRLEACFFKGKDTYEAKPDRFGGGRLNCSVSPESLPVLLRRLLENTEDTGEDGDDWDVGHSLVIDILNTLGFSEDETDCGCVDIVNPEIDGEEE